MGTGVKTGDIYWFTGLSGAGKTTIGRAFYELFRDTSQATVFLDGDALRQAIGDGLGYDQNDRLLCAMRYARLCKLLADQGTGVVIATISMLHEVHRWNRANIDRYHEIYIRVPIDILRSRDAKGIYKEAAAGNTKNVYGIDLPFEEPREPDLVIDNDGSQAPDDIAHILWERLRPAPLGEPTR